MKASEKIKEMRDYYNDSRNDIQQRARSMGLWACDLLEAKDEQIKDLEYKLKGVNFELSSCLEANKILIQRDTIFRMQIATLSGIKGL